MAKEAGGAIIAMQAWSTIITQMVHSNVKSLPDRNCAQTSANLSDYVLEHMNKNDAVNYGSDAASRDNA